MARAQILTTLDQTLQHSFSVSGKERKELLRFIRYNLVELSRDIVDQLSKEDFVALQRSVDVFHSFAYNIGWDSLVEICEALEKAIRRQDQALIASKTTELAELIKPVTEAPFRLRRRFLLK